jgi:hypothetical protein
VVNVRQLARDLGSENLEFEGWFAIRITVDMLLGRLASNPSCRLCAGRQAVIHEFCIGVRDMLAKMKVSCVILASVFMIVDPMANALAIPLKVARKCNALTTKAYPPLVPGNPAAGRANGNGHAVRTYFNRCVTYHMRRHIH